MCFIDPSFAQPRRSPFVHFAHSSVTMSSSNAAAGKREKQLKLVFAKALDKSLGACKPGDLGAQFKPEVLTEPGTLEIIQDYTLQIMEKVKDNIREEIDVIMDEYGMPTKLKELDSLDDEQPLLPNQTRVPPPAEAAPRAATRAAVMAVKVAERDRLRGELAALEAENAKAMESVSIKRQRVQTIAASVSDQKAGMETAVKACDAVKSG